MNLHYISPSILPSRAANSVHVIMQCDAFAQLGVHVTLYAKREFADKHTTLEKLHELYGINFIKTGIELISYYSRHSKAVNIRIAYMAIKHLFLTHWLKGNVDLILSRNLYASFLIGIVLRWPIMFETHQLETGFRKTLQRALIRAPWITTITISQKLVEFLQYHHGCPVENPLVLHDAAPEGIAPCADNVDRHALLHKVLPGVAEGKWDAICGYFGHLYQGRGIEVIEQMAIERPRVLFLVVGGNPNDVQARKAAIKSDNIIYVGHVPHPVAHKTMKLVDVLLMPYQESVSIGVTGHDTAKWMSPMKMFEYMASGMPLIASDLPVLREVLEDGKNALLVSPNNIKAWIDALDRLLGDESLAKTVGSRAHEDYKRKYTWNQRACRLLETVRTL